MTALLAHITGSIVGLAVGDALGYPHEFRSVAQVRRELGPDGITGFVALKDARFTRPFFAGPDHPAGTFTDDTQMSLAVAEALIESKGKSRAEVMGAMGRAFVEWYFSDDNNRSPGEATGIACERLRGGAAWSDSGVLGSKGCGANMRVAPIGLFYEDLDVVVDVARDSARITHDHPAACEGAAAAALAVALALRGVRVAAIHAEIVKRCSGRSAAFDDVIARVPAAIAHAPQDVLVDGDHGARPHALGEAWVADEAIACALYCAWRHEDDFAAGVLEAANTDGDSDSIACITGSILGARLGVDAVPRGWARDVEKSAHLHDVAARLTAARGR